MAIRSRSGVSGTTVALVVFIFLFVFLLIALVLMYSEWAEQKALAQEQAQSLQRYVSPAERDAQALTQIEQAARQENRSVVGQLQNQTQTLKSWITGSADVDMERLQQELQNEGVAVGQGETVLSAVGRLRSELNVAQSQIQDLQQQLQQQAQRVNATNQQMAQLQQARQQEIQALNQQLQNLQQDVAAYEQRIQEQTGQLQQAMRTAQDRAAEQIRERENTIRQLQRENQTVQAQLTELQSRLPSQNVDLPDPARQADGQIVSVMSEENIAYINLGRQDHVVLGMTFEVFDQTRGIRVEEDGTMQGKATVEVIGISPTSSKVRIVRRSQGARIQSNDLISNLVYDRNRSYTFYVYGNIDLNQDGNATQAEQDRVKSMIQQWGGQLTDQMTTQTDFIIIGQEPQMPRALPADVVDPTIIQENLQRRRAYEEFQQVVQEARSLSVPILNANRFLDLIGYYQR